MVYEVKREDLTEQQWQEMREIAGNNVCGICGADLQIRTHAEKGTIEVGCLNREHHGYIERTTYTQEFRRGEEIHPAIRDNIERKMILPGGQPIAVALSMIQTRFPRADMDEPSAALFLWDCVRLDLDPLLGEIFPATFKTKAKDGTEKKVVQPIISEDGWLSLAARACPDEWAGPPRTMRLEEYLQTQDAYKGKTYEEVKEIAKEIKKDLCGDPEAYVWVAVGRRKDQDDVATYGWYKKAEEGVVAKNLPGNQARVRAIKRWVREVFPEAKSKMKAMTAIWMDRAGDVSDIQNVIAAEYHIVTEIESPKGKELILGEVKVGSAALAPPKLATKTQASAAESLAEVNSPEESIEGEGFNINLSWLSESKQALKWTDETMLSFLAGPLYKVSGKSVTEALGKLTRKQAEEFTREINSRVENQPKLI